MENNNERELLESELRELRSSLEANTSEIGDWKIVKAMEYKLSGEDIPYDIDELNEKRQIVRKRINEIQSILEKKKKKIGCLYRHPKLL